MSFVIGHNSYDVDLDDPAAPQPARDPISDAVGSDPFVQGHVIDECRREFAGGSAFLPAERFDRFYFDAGLLMDILGADELTRAAQVDAKGIAFKQTWCRENGRVYVVIGEEDDETTVRQKIAEARKVIGAEPEAPSPETTRPVVATRRGRPPRATT